MLVGALATPAAAQLPAARTAIDERAPVQTRDTVVVRAGPAQVWAVLTNIGGWPAHYDFVRAAQPPAALRAGERFRWRTTKLNLTSTLLLVDPPRQLGWRGRKYGVTVYHFWHLVPQGDVTLVITEESQRGLLVSLLKKGFRSRLQAGSRLWLQQLKAAAEADPHTP
ncbi:SRPBCC domain-containing protein [Hymenobacter sp. IS2118]|uniref:SRPBCC domain-containing protein n=1 Tax=Hymenobacter sp. IS2118 TaxID=1505605 RepID=UPI00068B248F|nr:SRPBCC domain-containing protein [Hymenobacter sp. IS2118]